MIRNTFFCFCFVAVIAGCTTRGSIPPSWSTGVAESYPSSRYLTAVGEASSREQAEQRAFAALARVFEVEVQEQSTDYSLFRQATDQVSDSINRQVNTRQLITGTAQVIEGAVPVEYWRKKQQHLVLVALERSGADQRLRQKIELLDQQTEALSRYADNAQLNAVVQISALQQAYQLQRQRAPLNRNLSVVSGSQLTPSISIAILKQRIRDRLAGLRFNLSAVPDLQPALEQAIGQIGARVSAEGSLYLSAQMDREPVVWQQGWYWLRGSMQLGLSNSNGEVIAQQRWPVKVSAQDSGMVEQRLRDLITATVADKLIQLLSSAQIGE